MTEDTKKAALKGLDTCKLFETITEDMHERIGAVSFAIARLLDHLKKSKISYEDQFILLQPAFVALVVFYVGPVRANELFDSVENEHLRTTFKAWMNESWMKQ